MSTFDEQIYQKNQLKGINVYLDNLTAGGDDQQAHNQNLRAKTKTSCIERTFYLYQKQMSI